MALLVGAALAHRPQEKGGYSLMQANAAESSQGEVVVDRERDAEARMRIEQHILGNASKFLKEGGAVHLYCNDWCIKCAERVVQVPEAGAKGGFTQESRVAYWKVKRGQDKFKLLSRGVLAVAIVTAVGTSAFASMGTALLIAGAFAKIGISMFAVKVAGGIAAGMLVRELMTKPRDCPNLSFSQIVPQTSNWWNKFHSSQGEESFDISDLNLYEMMYDVEARNSKGQVVPGVQGERTRADWPPQGRTLEERNQYRMLMALSCNALMFKEELWAQEVFKTGDEHLRMIGRDKEFAHELVSHCGQWLCAGEVEEVKKISPMSTGSCGGRMFDFFKKKTGPQQKYVQHE